MNAEVQAELERAIAVACMKVRNEALEEAARIALAYSPLAADRIRERKVKE